MDIPLGPRKDGGKPKHRGGGGILTFPESTLKNGCLELITLVLFLGSCSWDIFVGGGCESGIVQFQGWFKMTWMLGIHFLIVCVSDSANVHWWFGARWFGFRRDPLYERHCYLGAPWFESQTTGPQTTNWALCVLVGSLFGKWARIEDVFPIKNGEIPASYVSLPEGGIVFDQVGKGHGFIMFTEFSFRTTTLPLCGIIGQHGGFKMFGESSNPKSHLKNMSLKYIHKMGPW